MAIKDEALEISHSRLLEVLLYDPRTGLFTWRRGGVNSVSAGSPAGCMTTKGYVAVKVDRRKYMAHRLAWFYVHGVWPINFIDHLNGVRTDNRLANLRDVLSSANSENRRKASATNKTGLLGVSRTKKNKKNPFLTTIQTGGEVKHVGYFPTAAEAHEAYVEAKRVLHKGCTL